MTLKNIVNSSNTPINYIQFSKLLNYPNLTHAFTTDINYSFKTDDTLPKEEYEKSVEDYKLLCSSLDLNFLDIVKPTQTHSTNIKVVKENIKGLNLEEYQNCDGLITNKKGLILTTVSADCIIFLMYDPKKQVIANIHSGWRGSLNEIGIKALDIMVKEFGSQPKDIIVCMTPSICQNCFIVKNDVKDLFSEKFMTLPNINDIIIKDKELWKIDTVLLNKTLFLNYGLDENNIVTSEICSCCHKNNMHSYRGSGVNAGRNTALIVLE